MMGQNEPDRLTMSVELLIKFRLDQVVESDTRWSTKLTTGTTLHENGIRGYVTQCVVNREDHRSARWKRSKLLSAGRWKSCHENVGRWPFFAGVLCPSFAPAIPLTVTATWQWTNIVFFSYETLAIHISRSRATIFLLFPWNLFFLEGIIPSVVSICACLSEINRRMARWMDLWYVAPRLGGHWKLSFHFEIIRNNLMYV